jgi:hypothetical protein
MDLLRYARALRFKPEDVSCELVLAHGDWDVVSAAGEGWELGLV